jgi:hypothetical protein
MDAPLETCFAVRMLVREPVTLLAVLALALYRSDHMIFTVVDAVL